MVTPSSTLYCFSLRLRPLTVRGPLPWVQVFPTIDRDPLLKPEVCAIKYIKTKHCLRYEGGRCFAAERSDHTGMEEFTLQLSAHAAQ
jgi:hypothetical protein